MKLEDGSYVCTYFDDYLKLKNIFENEMTLLGGYVRLSNNYEQMVIKQMSKEYDKTGRK